VGDTKDLSVFQPQIKIMRWDNEVNLSVRLKDNETGLSDISFDKDKILWSKGNITSRFYDIAPNTEHPEGAYEFEIIIKEKPLTNKIEFTLNTKGLDFFYQPELTQEEIKQGFSRPENVVGSYAVYVSDQKINYVGGKEYKVGKVGHIYRPKIEDEKGNWVWGELLIKDDILSVTIPQDFLDKAVYPVRHAAGLTFGYETLGANYGYAGANIIEGSKFTAPANVGTVQKLTIGGYNSTGGSINAKGIIVLDSSLVIVANGVGGAGSFPAYTTAWRDSTFSSNPTLSASTAYDLSATTAVSGHYLVYDNGDENQGLYDSTNSYTTPTNPTDATRNVRKYSIYATYTAGAGELPIPVAMHHYKMMRT
jgi:hypothetical protein